MIEGASELEIQLEALGRESSLLSQDLDEVSKRFDDLSKAGKSFASGLERDLAGAMRSLVVEGEGLSETFRNLALSVADRAFQSAMSPVLESVAGSVAMALPFAKGGVLANGNVQAFASGGVVENATYFPMQSGVGLMGEAGAEAILPLKRTDDGRLGVQSHSGQNVHVTMNISTPDSSGFRKSKTQIVTELQNALSKNG